MDAFFCFPLDGPITGGRLIREGGGGRISGSLRYSTVFCILNSTTFRCNIREKKREFGKYPAIWSSRWRLLLKKNVQPCLGLSTSCSRFSKKFPVISQNVAQSCSKNHQKLLFVTKVARKNKTFFGLMLKYANLKAVSISPN